jgi:HEPN domain-containing protein
MHPENTQLEEALEWLRVASDDLRLADAALALEPPITGLALYHAQQAAEKALKAYLVFRGHTFPFTHNLTELARPLAALDEKLLAIVRQGLDLSDFATLYRYPGEPEPPTVGQARPWIVTARAIHAAVEDRVRTRSEPSRGGAEAHSNDS